jgi:hypothetical protein
LAGDALSTAFSIVGAAGGVLGAAGAFIAWRVYRRDQARLAFNWSISWPTGGEPSLDVVVANDGRQPLSLESVWVTNAVPSGRLVRAILYVVTSDTLRTRFGMTPSNWRMRVPPAIPPPAHRPLSPSAAIEVTFPLASLVELGRVRLHLMATDSLGRQTTEALSHVLTEAMDQYTGISEASGST